MSPETQGGGDLPPVMGLIVGNGALPGMLLQALRQRGVRVVVAAHRGETDPALQTWADAWQWVNLGQFKRILDFFSREGVGGVVLAGGITKSSIWRVRPDALALRLVTSLKNWHDDGLLRAIAAMLESRGFAVLPVTAVLPELLAPRGVLSLRAPTPAEWDDIRFGWAMAKELGRLDIGQGVVVRSRVVVAAEAVEGTDAMIARAGGLGGGVVVKVVKPQQDRRLDLPTIGPRTMAGLAAVGMRVMAVEAGGTLLLEPGETIRLADRHGITLVGWDGESHDCP